MSAPSIDDLSGRLSPPVLDSIPPTRSPSPGSLGRRPQPLDSLHTRLRIQNPQPHRRSQIIDLSKARAGGTVQEESEGGPSMDIGILKDEVYDEYLGPTVAPLRRLMLRSLRWETGFLAWQQTVVRSPRLDRYFVYTSLLGTHSFFLIFLPMSFWIGSANFGRGLVNILAFGVYLSSAIKDLLCVPRPYSPPVTRLTIGTHHLEYGFPSTHSTNSVSIALFVYLWINALRNADAGTAAAAAAKTLGEGLINSRLWEAGLLYYAFSVVYGRIYAGMHSVVDCVAGSTLGAAISLAQWFAYPYVERFLEIPGFLVPLVTIPVGLFLVTVHPQPLDDCPCFEDAIAFLAVVMGTMNGRWLDLRFGLGPANENPLTAAAGTTSRLYKPIIAPDSALSAMVEPVLSTIREPLAQLGDIIPRAGALAGATGRNSLLAGALSLGKTVIMMVLGVSIILTVRVVAKTICQILLPPALRIAQSTFGVILPRRHYQSSSDVSARDKAGKDAKERGGVAPSSNGHAHAVLASGVSTQQDVASVPELKLRNGTAFPTTEGDGEAGSSPTRPALPVQTPSFLANSRRRAGSLERSKVKFSLGDGSTLPIPFTSPHAHLPGDKLSEKIAGALSAGERERQRREEESGLHFHRPGSDRFYLEEIKHYDADVLTKVVVYAAIGFFASSPIPALFVWLGLKA